VGLEARGVHSAHPVALDRVRLEPVRLEPMEFVQVLLVQAESVQVLLPVKPAEVLLVQVQLVHSKPGPDRDSNLAQLGRAI
jgi:hypothetical protein